MLKELFHRIARRVSNAIGTPLAFILALLTIVTWAVTGPIFGYSDTWQLIINTATTVVTFLVVFLIQNTQNHDSRALHLKLGIHSWTSRSFRMRSSRSSRPSSAASGPRIGRRTAEERTPKRVYVRSWRSMGAGARHM